jgi:hypothetical protein
MYIVVIAWAYVVLLMSATEASLTAAILTALFYGLLPCGLLLWIMALFRRRRSTQRLLNQPNRPDTETDQ